ncbi:DNA repair and recombination protein RadB [Candidatus Woesearchaeota archaeon]|nr:DNA repair and recombination protein RadB [Candidatus Woesearchaeota archaeon]
MPNTIPTGSKILDRMLNGGYEKDIITTIYGPAGSGKTILCMLCSINLCRNGKKVIYVDTENNFSAERLKQVAAYDYNKILDRIIFLKPTSFEEQMKAFDKLRNVVDKNIGLIVVDTIGMLYRIELGKNEDVYNVNRELGRQISCLSEIARKKHIPVLLANQVYADFENKGKVNIVGGDLLKYSSKCMIELQATPAGNRRALLRKHRSIQADQEITFKIVEGGIIGTREGKGFRLF